MSFIQQCNRRDSAFAEPAAPNIVYLSDERETFMLSGQVLKVVGRDGQHGPAAVKLTCRYLKSQYVLAGCFWGR